VIDGLIIVLYLFGMMGVGVWGYRKAETLDDYLVAGRNIPLWMYIPVMSTVILGGASTLVGGGLGYSNGISGAWLVIILGLGIAAVGLLISTDLAGLRAYTLGEVLTRRYDQYSGTVGAVVATVYALTIAVVQTISIGVVVSALSGMDQSLAILIGGVIVIAYTALGGMWSVTITDLVQWVIMTLGMLIAIPIALSQAGGMSGLRANLDPSFFDPTAIGGDRIITWFLLYFLGLMIGQDIWQRVFTADSPKTAKIGNIGAGLYSIAYGLATAFLGMIALVLVPGIDNPDFALPTLILERIPTGLAGLILAGFISAMMSTADAALLASSTLFTNDIYKRFINPNASQERYTFVSRMGIVVMGVFMIAAAIWIGNVFDALALAYNILTGAIFVPIMGAFFWKGGTWQGALSSIIVSTIAVVVAMMIHGFAANSPIIIGLVTSTVVFVGVSLFTGPPPAQQLEHWRDDEVSA
jgi:SSS family solute:Na+ symporter